MAKNFSQTIHVFFMDGQVALDVLGHFFLLLLTILLEIAHIEKVNYKQDRDKEPGSSYGFCQNQLDLKNPWVISNLHVVIPQLRYIFRVL